jgi:hypothetical protein
MVTMIDADILKNNAGEVLIACSDPLPLSRIGYCHHNGGGIDILIDGCVAGFIEASDRLPDTIMLFAPNAEKGNLIDDAIKITVAA